MQAPSSSHIHTVSSRLPLAELEYATPMHPVSWPSNTLIHSHSPVRPNALSSSEPPSCARAQRPIFESDEAVADACLRVTARTVFDASSGRS